jgi:CheY-like chemotaxis protein
MNSAGYGGSITKTDTITPPVLSVLYVDDEPFLLNAGKSYLERRPDISVSVASSVENALSLLASSSFDVIVSDYQMPGTDGIGFLQHLRKNQCHIPFILFTGLDPEEIMDAAMNAGAMFYIRKSGNPRTRFAELEQKIREASRRRAGRTLSETGPGCTTVL